MKINFSKDPLRLILGGILLVVGVLSLIGIHFTFDSTLFTLAGIVTGILLVVRTRFL